jgi:hypothetical protein
MTDSVKATQILIDTIEDTIKALNKEPIAPEFAPKITNALTRVDSDADDNLFNTDFGDSSSTEYASSVHVVSDPEADIPLGLIPVDDICKFRTMCRDVPLSETIRKSYPTHSDISVKRVSKYIESIEGFISQYKTNVDNNVQCLPDLKVARWMERVFKLVCNLLEHHMLNILSDIENAIAYNRDEVDDVPDKFKNLMILLNNLRRVGLASWDLIEYSLNYIRILLVCTAKNNKEHNELLDDYDYVYRNWKNTIKALADMTTERDKAQALTVKAQTISCDNFTSYITEEEKNKQLLAEIVILKKGPKVNIIGQKKLITELTSLKKTLNERELLLEIAGTDNAKLREENNKFKIKHTNKDNIDKLNNTISLLEKDLAKSKMLVRTENERMKNIITDVNKRADVAFKRADVASAGINKVNNQMKIIVESYDAMALMYEETQTRLDEQLSKQSTVLPPSTLHGVMNTGYDSVVKENKLLEQEVMDLVRDIKSMKIKCQIAEKQCKLFEDMHAIALIKNKCVSKKDHVDYKNINLVSNIWNEKKVSMGMHPVMPGMQPVMQPVMQPMHQKGTPLASSLLQSFMTPNATQRGPVMPSDARFESVLYRR